MSTRSLFAALAGLLLIVAAASLARTVEPTATIAHPPVDQPPTVPNAVNTVGDGVVSVVLTADQAMHAVGDTEGLALVEVRGDEDAARSRTPVAMTLVIDTSGSMAGDKIEQARAAAIRFVEQLVDGDVVSVVSYGRAATVIVPATELSGNRASIYTAIERLSASGNTCMSCGMIRGYHEVEEAPSHYARRVVVLSDGQANDGIHTASGLGGLAETQVERGTVTSAIGLGEDYDETTMSAVATQGAGHYYFLPDASQMASIFERELRSLESIVASNVVVTIDAAAGVGIDAAHVVGAEQDGNTVRVVVRQLSAGEVRRFVLPVTFTAGVDESLAVTVDYEAAGGQAASLSHGLAFVRTTDEDAAKASARADVIAAWELVRALDEAEVAMNQMREGDVGGAATNLDDVVARLEAQSAALGDEELAEEAQNMRDLRDRIARPGFSGNSAEGRGLYLQNAARAAESSSGVAREQMYHDSTVY